MKEKKKVSIETIVRTIVLFATLINAVLTMLGKNPIPLSEDELYTAFSAVATIAASIWAWWKNNSFTTEAIIADEYLHELKADKNAESED